jgi:hypothetical protein
MSITRRAARGAIVGLVVPLIAFAIFFALEKLNVRLMDHYITELFLLALAILEIPGVSIGRTLGLPIEASDIAFVLIDLNAFGYALVVATWGVLGSLIDMAIGFARSNSSSETRAR